MPTGLYVHVPFCVKKCSYCGFYSIPYRQNSADGFRDALLKEMDIRLQGKMISTLYAGGGTPTILPPVFWKEFLLELGKVAFISGISESTIETNPGVISVEELAELRTCFNRLSIGVQSFQDDLLQVLGRIHDGGQAVIGFEDARKAGFRNISIDLIYGIPGQTLGQWQDDLKRALELRPEHMSCYELTLEEETPMWESVRKGELSKPDDELCADMYFLADEMLTSNDFIHYEVSNYARGNNHTSMHNCGYWRRAPYIGLGPSAHSFDGVNRRSWNLHSVDGYIENLSKGKLPESGSESLSRQQTAQERIMLGLRCCGGIDLDSIEKETGVVVDRDYLNIMIEHGRVVQVDSRLVPTAAGKLFADGDAVNLIVEAGKDLTAGG
jgi:oxygen-independent coproporphyrinogen-3 oxidase